MRDTFNPYIVIENIFDKMGDTFKSAYYILTNQGTHFEHPIVMRVYRNDGQLEVEVYNFTETKIEKVIENLGYFIVDYPDGYTISTNSIVLVDKFDHFYMANVPEIIIGLGDGLELQEDLNTWYKFMEKHKGAVKNLPQVSSLTLGNLDDFTVKTIEILIMNEYYGVRLNFDDYHIINEHCGIIPASILLGDFNSEVSKDSSNIKLSSKHSMNIVSITKESIVTYNIVNDILRIPLKKIKRYEKVSGEIAESYLETMKILNEKYGDV